MSWTSFSEVYLLIFPFRKHKYCESISHALVLMTLTKDCQKGSNFTNCCSLLVPSHGFSLVLLFFSVLITTGSINKCYKHIHVAKGTPVCVHSLCFHTVGEWSCFNWCYSQHTGRKAGGVLSIVNWLKFPEINTSTSGFCNSGVDDITHSLWVRLEECKQLQQYSIQFQFNFTCICSR